MENSVLLKFEMPMRHLLRRGKVTLGRGDHRKWWRVVGADVRFKMNSTQLRVRRSSDTFSSVSSHTPSLSWALSVNLSSHWWDIPLS